VPEQGAPPEGERGEKGVGLFPNLS
jgi:hypothetical protein